MSTQYILNFTVTTAAISKTMRKVNLVKLGAKLSTTSDQIKYCQENNILPSETNCNKCGKVLSTGHRNGNECYFRCCQKKYNLRKNTLLENAKISLRKFILLIYCFVNPTFTYSQVMEETSITSIEEEDESKTTAKTTVNKYYTMFRNMICDEMLLIGNKKI